MDDLHSRIELLERARWRDRTIACGVLATLCAVATLGARARDADDLRVGTLTADRIVVLDDAGRTRIVLGQDPPDTQRRSRACGMLIFDHLGAERGGLSCLDDLSVVIGLDAPLGVGASMPDRIGLSVGPDGAASISLINNDTMLPVRLVSEADGSGGVEFLDYDLDAMTVEVTRWNHEGRSSRLFELGDGK